MAYRGSGPSCYRHSAQLAAETCSGCARPICEGCVQYASTSVRCPECAGEERRGRARWRAAARAASGVAAAMAASALLFVVSAGHTRHGGVERAHIEALTDKLERDPCDRAAALELAEALLRAGDFRGVVRHDDAFTRACGSWTRLEWTAFNAHRYLGEPLRAVEIATELIDRSPGDQNFRWWRGLAYEQLGDGERAAADYREALRLEPRLDQVPFNLIDVLEKLGRPCEGLPVLESYLKYRPNDRRSPILLGRRDHLRAAGCPTTL